MLDRLHGSTNAVQRSEPQRSDTQGVDEQRIAEPHPFRLKPSAPLRRKSIWVVLAAITLVALHGPFLRGVSKSLIIDEPHNSPVDAVLIASGDSRYEQAANCFRQGGCKQILLVAELPRRLVRYGINKPSHDVERAKLIELGVPANCITVLGDSRYLGDWRRGRLLAEWIQDKDAARVIVLCESLRSGRERFVLDRVLRPADARRVYVCCLPSQEFNESIWWKTRSGCKSVFSSSLSALYAMFYGEESYRPITWDQDEFEQTLRQAWESAIDSY